MCVLLASFSNKSIYLSPSLAPEKGEPALTTSLISPLNRAVSLGILIVAPTCAPFSFNTYDAKYSPLV